jgi:hypothetical protein
MPIRPALRWFYPIDWPQLSRWVRFTRAGGCCEMCRRPHLGVVTCVADGRWLDVSAGRWRDGRGRLCPLPCPDIVTRTTRVILAAAHLDHDPGHNAPGNLRSLCQRCHMLHDRPYHLAQRRRGYLRGLAIGDLFLGRYSG